MALAVVGGLAGCRASADASPASASKEPPKLAEIESWTCIVRHEWDDRTWSTLHEVVPNPADPDYEGRKPLRLERRFYVFSSEAPASLGRIAQMALQFAPINAEAPPVLQLAEYQTSVRGPRVRTGTLRFAAADGTAFERDAASHSTWLDLFSTNWIKVKDAAALEILTGTGGWALSNLVGEKTISLGPLAVPQRPQIEQHLASSWSELDAVVAQAPDRCLANEINWSAREAETI